MDLADFEGRWHVARLIEDALGPGSGTFRGTARFDPVPDGLAYAEEGWLLLASGATMAASRRYLWRRARGGIAVSFEDGRPFHCIDGASPRPEAVHDCSPDLYRVRYDFSAWPRWTAEWQVAGPRKGYRMVSRYRRLDRAGDIGHEE
jgi:hypothetical protein